MDIRNENSGETPTAQVLMVGIADEIFAIDAGMVREIIDPIPVTRVAGARPHLGAVINVRGNVIPLADLRIRFGMTARAATPDTRIVVIELPIDGDPVSVGITADKVHAVTEIASASAQHIPRVGMALKPEYIRSIVKWNDAFVIVPEMEKIL